jgi:hypothetical protein
MTEYQQQRRAASVLAVLSGAILLSSLVAYFWGTQYTESIGNSLNAGLRQLVGQRDTTYELAIVCLRFAPIGIFCGVGLSILASILGVSALAHKRNG